MPRPRLLSSRSSSRSSSFSTILYEYVSRLLAFRQMDFQFACSQMVSLCRSPNDVYKATKLRKQIKNQWARDDPAFVAILLVFMTVSAISFCIAFGSLSLFQFFSFVLWAVLFDFLALGLLIATMGWYLSNTHLTISSPSLIALDHSIEWLYSFDIHCNSFFPTFILLYVIQYFLSPFLIQPWLSSLLVANTLYAAAFSYYWYITFLGYNTLPSLTSTERFLWPIVIIVLLCLVVTLLGCNLSRLVLGWYFRK